MAHNDNGTPMVRLRLIPQFRRSLCFLIVVAALALAAAVPQAAQASWCSMGGSSTTINRSGDVAKFRNLHALRGMNCPSARYVMNKWLRRAFARSYAHRLPRSFYDGYVTWYCGKRSRLRWQCDEYDSGTAFRFTAYMID